MQWLEKNSMHFSAASSTTRTIRRHRASPHSTYTTVSTDDSIISSRKKFACFWKGRLGVCGASKASYRDAFKVSTSIWEPRKKYQCTVGKNQCKLWHLKWLFLNISYSMSSNFWVGLCVKIDPFWSGFRLLCMQWQWHQCKIGREIQRASEWRRR